MLGWRGRIGFVIPGDWIHGPEYDPVLPEGIIMVVTTLGVERLVPEDFERVFNMYLPAAKHLATQECDVIVAGGTPVFTYMGYERSLEMAQNIAETTGIPALLDLQAAFDALQRLSAKKIVIATPYTETRNEERKNLCERLGFTVVNIKGLGIERRVDLGKQPPDASYRLAKQAFLEAPEADAIWISCPEWPTVRNIEKLEAETGRPVVTAVNSVVWASLSTMRFKGQIRGYGRLLESLSL